MMRALYTAASGMKAGQTNVDTIANNLSNVNTNGYKTTRTEFKSLLYQTLQTKTTTANGEEKPVGAQVGLGTRVASTTTMYTQGAMNASESATDFALEGNGFFAIRGADGQTYYTRNGNFTWAIDADGNTLLTDVEGCPVLDREGNPIYVPKTLMDEEGNKYLADVNDRPILDEEGNMIYLTENTNAESMRFSQSGQVGYALADGTYVDLGQQFGIYQFNNPAGLEKLSYSRLLPSEASGQPVLEDANGVGASKVCQYYLEGSNVQVAEEMVNMIIAQRAYEMNSKAIQTADSMLQTANDLKR